jgi:hypothetical protein
MAAPEFVPAVALAEVRTYESPPRRGDPWWADRPGDLTSGQPDGDGFGAPGPDQGYALKLADDVFRAKLIHGTVHADDVIAGCLGIALRRAALFGRAPTAHDLRVAFTVWGFLDVSPDADLVALREELFAEVSNPHHYTEARHIAMSVGDDVLRRSHTEVEQHYTSAGWRTLLTATAVDSLEVE